MEEDRDALRLSPRKRLKTLSPSASLKGKEKMLPPETTSPELLPDPSSSDGDDVCGICLSEVGMSIQGRIDSCDHYFCFVCIMEWSKVESRCPMCKQRFGSIRRPPVRGTGTFLRERIVRIPVRDQGCHHGLTENIDPYANVNCSLCQRSNDENLLLLCDLCDSAAHTYCVGLGATVPEGDWFCSDCEVTRNQHSKLEIECDPCVPKSPIVIAGYCDDNQPVSITDIVSDDAFCDRLGGSYKTRITSTSTSSKSNLLSPESTVQIQSKSSLQLSSVVTGKNTFPSTMLSEQGARTLRQCRYVHDRIRKFRENWDSFRNGSLSFTAGHLDCRKVLDKKQQFISPKSSSSGKIKTTCLNNSEHLETENSVSPGKFCSTNSQDVVRAWKRMEAAKVIQKTHGSSVFTSPASSRITKKSFPWKNRDLKAGPLPNQKSAGDKASCTFNSRIHYCKSETNERKEPCKSTMFEGSAKQNRSLTTIPSKHCNRLQVILPHERSQDNTSHQIRDDLPKKQDLPASSSFLMYDKKRDDQLSKSERKLSKVKLQTHNASSNSSSKTTNDTKSEVQSLVKLNLKLQLTSHPLGEDKFREVARIATHTILAACGLEHSKSSARSFPSMICKHHDQQRFKSMPSLCRKCFFSFVKQVVNSVLS